MSDTHLIYQPGLLALASSELARYSASRSFIEGITRPGGSLRYTATSLSVAENWNDAAQVLIDTPRFEWLLLLNDDHLYPPNVLIKLLDRMMADDRDAVTALYYERAIPFGPVLFDTSTEPYQYTRRFLRKTDGETIEVDACGDGCLLVHRRVIETLYAQSPIIWELGFGGRAQRAQSNHDMCFCAKLRAAGFRITADLTVRVGHITPMAIWPERASDGQWQVDVRPRADRTQGLRLEAATGEEPA